MDKPNDIKTESSMLKYCKFILDKMSFDRRLFRKEYRKSLKWLNREECLLLKAWTRIRFRKRLSVYQDKSG